MYNDLALFIGGEWKHGGGRKGEDVVNPATEKPLAHLPHASASDLDHALAAAKKGFEVWRATSAYDRAKVLRKAANLVRQLGVNGQAADRDTDGVRDRARQRAAARQEAALRRKRGERV